ncbi:MAG: hypothetical protein KKC29_12490 [Alphaproteobacteria bacterium]|jgi:hypothetical protein|nr:hypothetical protein [Alphaproteobacteria bacterium]MBU2041730.1 hypothetical protein [Alphaproteobacteria bacterium]MBU2126901.1 hypothetical protein [Alphaproteobacteria bacterium]MBU2208492.1 hypothetical protein [Alphaproteobacteria bacterium]MBU2291907.1 hypothetical protein [Alphaproteobacteria bacterium]
MITALLLIALIQDGPVRTAPASDPAPAPQAPAAEARDAPGEATTDRASRYSLFRRREPVSADNGVPIWALTNPHRWEQVQCGSAGDDACRRQARNRLAMARAGAAAEPPAPSGSAAPRQNCRTVMRRSESGFGGSLTRVCGDEPASDGALESFEDTMRPVVEPCDRPANLETQEAWIARCRALPTP